MMILLLLVEGPAPQVMEAETEYDHLEGISLLSASLTPGFEHVTAVIEVPQVRLSGAHRPEILKHVAQFSTNSLNIVTVFEPACVITGCFAT
jgi:hypothetical protein